MTAKLYCKHGEMKGTTFTIEGEATIGRSRDNVVSLEPAAISSQHARIFFEPDKGCFFLEDLDSLNGTQLDSIPVTRPERLGYLHVITFAGVHDFIFQDLNLCQKRHSEPAKDPRESTLVEGAPPIIPRGVRYPSTEPDRPPLDDTASEEQPPGLPPGLGAGLGANTAKSSTGKTVIEGDAVAMPDLRSQNIPAPATEGAEPGLQAESEKKGTVFYLEIRHRRGPMERFRLFPGGNVIGRSKKCQIRIEREQISRRHAVLNLDGEKITLKDEGSRNHTFVGTTRIDKEVEIEPGAKVRFGDVQARLTRSPEE